MMERLFIVVLNMSITASYIILAVLLIRLLLRRAPKGLVYFLWVLPLVRLTCPFAFESPASLVPSAEAVLPEILYAESPSIHTGLAMLNSTVNPVLETHLSPQPGVTPTPMYSTAQVASIVWMVLMGCMLLYGLISCLRLYGRLRFATRCADGAWETDRIDMPLVFGLLRPRIYLPVNLTGEERAYILEHERRHIRHGDHVVKFLAYLVLTVHCFNPFVWIFYMLMGRDMEMRCDEAVLRRCGGHVRGAYSHSLLVMAARRSGIVIPLAFGESGAKSRVKNILRYKKPALWVLASVAALGMILAVFFLTNPVKDVSPGVTVAPEVKSAYAPITPQALNALPPEAPVADNAQVPLFRDAAYYELDCYQDGKCIQRTAVYEAELIAAVHSLSDAFMGEAVKSSIVKTAQLDQGGDYIRLTEPVSGESWVLFLHEGSAYFGMDTLFFSVSMEDYDRLADFVYGEGSHGFTPDAEVEPFLKALEAADHTDFLPMACREVTPAELRSTPYRIYKFMDTFASYLFYKGEAYLLGGHFGGWGLMSALPYSDGLLFTYSWGSGLHRSHIGWFDAKNCDSGALNFIYGELEFVYYGGDMLLEATGPDAFDVYAALFEAGDGGEPEAKQGELLGSIRYEQGAFRFNEK